MQSNPKEWFCCNLHFIEKKQNKTGISRDAVCLAPPGSQSWDSSTECSSATYSVQLCHRADPPPAQPSNTLHQGSAFVGPLLTKALPPSKLSWLFHRALFSSPTFQPSYSQPPYNQGGYSQGYTAPPPPPPPPPAYNYGSYGGYNPAPYTPPPPPTAQTYPQPSYNQYQQVGARNGGRG